MHPFGCGSVWGYIQLCLKKQQPSRRLAKIAEVTVHRWLTSPHSEVDIAGWLGGYDF